MPRIQESSFTSVIQSPGNACHRDGERGEEEKEGAGRQEGPTLGRRPSHARRGVSSCPARSGGVEGGRTARSHRGAPAGGVLAAVLPKGLGRAQRRGRGGGIGGQRPGRLGVARSEPRGGERRV